MGFTTPSANSILGQYIKNGNYIGLSSTAPNDAGGNFTEPGSDTGYARAKLNDMIGTPSNKQVNNTAIIFFNLSRGEGYGTVTHFGVFTAASGGTPVFTGPLTSAINIAADYVPIFDVGALKIGLDKDELE